MKLSWLKSCLVLNLVLQPYCNNYFDYLLLLPLGVGINACISDFRYLACARIVRESPRLINMESVWADQNKLCSLKIKVKKMCASAVGAEAKRMTFFLLLLHGSNSVKCGVSFNWMWNARVQAGLLNRLRVDTWIACNTDSKQARHLK